MRWDAKMMRRLAVPLALRNVENLDRNTMAKTRTLNASQGDPIERHIISTLADNRARIERLQGDIGWDSGDVDCSDILNELEYLKADIELGLVEIEADLEDAPTSEEILSEEAEAVLA